MIFPQTPLAIFHFVRYHFTIACGSFVYYWESSRWAKTSNTLRSLIIGCIQFFFLLFIFNSSKELTNIIVNSLRALARKRLWPSFGRGGGGGGGGDDA